MMRNNMVVKKTKIKKITSSEEKYRQIFELSPEAIVVLDKKGGILNVNNRLYDWLGYKPEEIIGVNIMKVPYFSKASKVKIAAKFAKRMMGADVQPYRLEFIAKDRQKKIGLISGVPIKNEKGKIVQDLVMITDVTNRSIAENKIKESEERFSNLFNNMSSGVAIYKPINNGESFIVKNINKAGDKLTNTKKKDTVNKKVREVFPGVKEMGLFSVFQEVSKTGKSQYFPTKLYEDGRLHKWYSNFVYRLPNGEIAAVFDDKTKEKQAELKLKDNESRLNRSLSGQELLADIAVKFNSEVSFDKIINETLEILGKHTQVNRVYIFKDSLNQEFTTNIYEWCNKDTDPQIDNLQRVPYKTMTSLKKVLDKGDVFKINDIKELPKSFYDELAPQRIKSLLAIAIFVRGKQFGFIGFDDTKSNREWETSDVQLLRTVAGVIGNSYERELAQSELEDKMEDLEKLNKAMIGREMKMMELKEENKNLKK
jgi:PAS domain S-box-containing protein